jgi:hypothetical protein
VHLEIDDEVLFVEMAGHVPVVHGQSVARCNCVRGKEAARALVIPVKFLWSVTALLKSIHASAQVISSVKHDDVLDVHASAIGNPSDLFESGGVELLKGWEIDGFDDLRRNGPAR